MQAAFEQEQKKLKVVTLCIHCIVGRYADCSVCPSIQAKAEEERKEALRLQIEQKKAQKAAEEAALKYVYADCTLLLALEPMCVKWWLIV